MANVNKMMKRFTGRMLDLGSGILEYDDVPGMDSADNYGCDPDVTQEAQEHLDEVSPGCKFFNQLVNSESPLPVPDNYYHVIRYSYGMAWVDDEKDGFASVAKEIERILAPGGMLIMRESLSPTEGVARTPEELNAALSKWFPNCCVDVESSYDKKDNSIRFIAWIVKNEEDEEE